MFDQYTDAQLIAELIARGNYDVDNEGQAIIYSGVKP